MAKTADTLNRTELAKVLGFSTKAVDNWRVRGIPCDESGKLPRYVVADVVAWLRAQDIQQANANGKRADGAIDLDELRERKALADTEIAELALEQARGAVVPVEIVVSEVEDCFLRMRAKLLAMRTRYAGRWARITTTPKMKSAIEAAVFEVLDELTAADDIAGVAGKSGKTAARIRPPPTPRPSSRRSGKTKKTG